MRKQEAEAAKTATSAKTSLENKHLGNDDCVVFIASSSHPLLLSEHVASGPVEASLNLVRVLRRKNKETLAKHRREQGHDLGDPRKYIER